VGAGKSFLFIIFFLVLFLLLLFLYPVGLARPVTPPPSCPPGVQPLASGVQFVQFALLDLFCSKKCKICFTNLVLSKKSGIFAAESPTPGYRGREMSPLGKPKNDPNTPVVAFKTY
jgi:hypothetical protein